MLTFIMNSKPDDVKGAIEVMLHEVKRVAPADPHSRQIYAFQESFLKTEDFEAIFDSYDILGINTVPKSYLIQALKVCGVNGAEQIIQDRYQELVKEDSINKVTFVYVLEEEHKRLGYSI